MYCLAWSLSFLALTTYISTISSLVQQKPHMIRPREKHVHFCIHALEMDSIIRKHCRKLRESLVKKAIQIQEVLYVLPLNMLQLKIHLFRNFWGCLLMVLRFGNIFIYLPSLSYISQEQILMAFFAFIISSVCSFCLYSSSSSWFCSLSCLLL